MAQHVLSQIEGSFVLGGLSMGGYVALEVWRQAPERVQGLLLCNTSHRADAPEKRTARQQTMELVRRGGYSQVLRLFRASLVTSEYLNDPAAAQQLMDMLERTPAATYLQQQTAILGRSDHLETLPHIQCPALVIGGQHDPLTPPHLHQEMAERLPHATLHLYENCGHLSPLEAGETFTRHLLEWITRLE
jgi:pimeloyl-ACP methyl ester carboxylesterase